MGKMLANARAFHECEWGCCSDLRERGHRGAHRWHRTLRAREGRAWRADVRMYLAETREA